MHDYETEKWRIISQKVGPGFSAAACKEKSEMLELESASEQEEEVDRHDVERPSQPIAPVD